MFPNGHTPQKTYFAEYFLLGFEKYSKITFRDVFFLLYHVLNHIHCFKKEHIFVLLFYIRYTYNIQIFTLWYQPSIRIIHIHWTLPRHTNSDHKLDHQKLHEKIPPEKGLCKSGVPKFCGRLNSKAKMIPIWTGLWYTSQISRVISRQTQALKRECLNHPFMVQIVWDGLKAPVVKGVWYTLFVSHISRVMNRQNSAPKNQPLNNSWQFSWNLDWKPYS